MGFLIFIQKAHFHILEKAIAFLSNFRYNKFDIVLRVVYSFWMPMLFPESNLLIEFF